MTTPWSRCATRRRHFVPRVVLIVLVTLAVAIPVGGCSAPAGATLTPSGPSEVTAIVNVTVVPMDSERVLEEQTVLILGDRIASMGTADEITVPANAQVIDGRGRWLMPGLADMHVHLWDPEHLTLFLANGVTLVRNMWGTPMQLGMRASLANGDRFGPAVVTAGALLDGAPPIWPGSTMVESPEDARAEVRQMKEAGYDLVKVYNRLQPDVYEAIVAAADEYDIPVGGHVPDAVGLDGVLAAGQHTIEHLSGYLKALAEPGAGGRPGSWSGDPDDIDQDALR